LNTITLVGILLTNYTNSIKDGVSVDSSGGCIMRLIIIAIIAEQQNFIGKATIRVVVSAYPYGRWAA
jgi:hypothetical protein